MTKNLRIVMAQLNLLVGDIQGNLEKLLRAANKARDDLSANLIVFPELSITGYSPADLLLRKQFIMDARDALQQFTASISGIYCLVGHPHAGPQGLYNACSLIFNGKIVGRYAKQHLPNYGVFDENRYFIPGDATCVLPIQGFSAGLAICEDLWHIEPAQAAAQHGARIILSINASPFELGKHEHRLSVLAKRATHSHLPIVYVNQVHGHDELIFDGGSMVVNAKGELCQFAGCFAEALLPVDIDMTTSTPAITATPASMPHQIEKVYQALVFSLREYVVKNHFSSVILGLSGGIDSALTLAIAVDALGKEAVHAVIMPSRYTQEMSIEDANQLARAVGVKTQVISIEPTYKSFMTSLAPSMAGKKPDVTEENIQARCRAVILMAISNKFGHLVLTTGNRSELAVGYCTLYGDMAGGFAVLKDVPKTMVYELANYRNQQHAIIPQRIIDRAPTAELAYNQKDEDSLPPYPMLDAILERYLNRSQDREEIIAQGFDRDTVTRVIHLIYKSEHKRRQSAPGPHLHHKSFAKDWRYPLTHGWKG